MKKTGKNHTDRGKRGVKRSVVTDGRGVPLGIVVAPANWHDTTLITVLLSLSDCSTSQTKHQSSNLPHGFVYLDEVAPSIIQEIRYSGNHNFVGKPIPGYQAPKCILTEAAAEGLSKVQAELKEYAMSLKVYDCYRPQRAVDSFVLWAKDINDTEMRKEFYPKVDKTNLFKDGYIDEKSGHSRGSTMDLTIVPLPLPKQAEYHAGEQLIECYLPANKRFNDNTLDFGTGFDCFDPLAHTANPEVGNPKKRNRLMLKSLMEKNGFKNLATEWWHYTLQNELFPNTYFNFEVK